MSFRRVLKIFLVVLLFPIWTVSAYDSTCEIVVVPRDSAVAERAERLIKKNSSLSDREIAELIKRELLLRSVVIVKDEKGKKCVLITKPKLQSIEISGLKDIEKKRFMKSADLKVGGRIDLSQIPKIIDKFQTFLMNEGYPRAQVDMQCLEKAVSTVRCKVSVAMGHKMRIGEVFVSGVERRFLNCVKFKGFKGKVFKRDKIVGAVKRTLRCLVKKGFKRAKVDGPFLIYRRRDVVDIAFIIRSGPKIVVKFEGSGWGYYRSLALKKLIRWDEEKDFSEGFFSEAVEAIRNFYLKSGYPFVNVKHISLKNRQEKTELHVFKIVRGPRIRIGDVSIEGNKSLNKKELRKRFFELSSNTTREGLFCRTDVEKVVDLLEDYYRSKGFLNAEVSLEKIEINKKSKKAFIFLKIEEGIEFKVKKVFFSGCNLFTREFVLSKMGISEGKRLNSIKMMEGKRELLSLYRKKGYLFADISCSVRSVDEENVEVICSFFEGDKVKFGLVYISGNRRTRRSVIKRELTIKTGDVFNTDKIVESQENLQRLGVFRAVEILPLSYDAGRKCMDIRVIVHERKRVSVRFKAGVGSEEGIRTVSDTVVSNIGGAAGVLSTRVQVSNKVFDGSDLVERRVVTNYREPRLLGDLVSNKYNVDGRLKLSYEKDARTGFNLERFAILTAIDKTFTRRIKGSLFWDLEFREPSDIADPSNVTIDPLDEERSRLGSVGSLISFDFRNNRFNPTKGYLGTIQLNLYNDTFLSESDFYQLEFINNFFTPFTPWLRFALSVRMGFSATYGSTADNGVRLVPLEKRFRLGGSDSLRGFPKDGIGGEGTATGSHGNEFALGGNSMFNYMAELIFPITSNFEFVAFTDGGDAFLSNSDFNPFDIRHTAGAGFRYLTPIGPLRVEYGIVLDRKTGEDFGRLHFAVGMF